MWDNILKIVTLNLIFLVITAIPVFLPMLFSKFTDSSLPGNILMVLGVFICSMYLATAAFSLKSISDNSDFSFGDLLRNFKYAWRSGLVMGFFIVLLYLVFTVIIPFYLGFESTIGGLLAVIVFWAAVFAVLSFQFYFTVYIRLGKSIVKSFKKCMIISLDNTGLAVFMIINNFIALILSVPFAFMFPGPVGVLLYLDEALRLRLLKYDWLEANPGANRKKIPWDELLIEEREKTGTRSLRNFIFPWKD